MARTPNEIPAYLYHLSGNARTTICSEDYYLGPHGSSESRTLYAILIAEYFATEEPPAKDWFEAQKRELKAKFADPQQTKSPITVRAVTAIYRPYIDELYDPSSTSQYPEHNRLHNLCDLLEDEYGDLSVDDFRPSQLKDLRSLFVSARNKRPTVNRQVDRIVEIFRYAAGEGDLIADEVPSRLEKVRPLKKGQRCSEAGGKVPDEHAKRRPVPINDVRETCKYLSPTLRSMLILMASTGMRPSEIFRLTPGQIDQTNDEAWIYCPERHKTLHHGVDRQVPIVGEAIEALRPFIGRPDEVPCYSPAESKEWYFEQRAANRKTKDGQGNYRGSREEQKRKGRGRKPDPKRTPGKVWNKDSFRTAIRRQCERHGITVWTPYQLRHTAASEANKMGAEYARALLGHKSTKMTDNYIAQDLELAINAAKGMPQLGILRPDDNEEVA